MFDPVRIHTSVLHKARLDRKIPSTILGDLTKVLPKSKVHSLKLSNIALEKIWLENCFP